MNNVRVRLRDCFAVVFPELGPGEIELATPASVANWDSLATVTLVSVIEEEFGVALAIENMGQGISFELVLMDLEEHARRG